METSVSPTKRRAACMERFIPTKTPQPAWSFRTPTKVRADLHENFVEKLSSKKIHFFCNANPSAVVLRTNKIKKWNS